MSQVEFIDMRADALCSHADELAELLDDQVEAGLPEAGLTLAEYSDAIDSLFCQLGLSPVEAHESE